MCVQFSLLLICLITFLFHLFWLVVSLLLLLMLLLISPSFILLVHVDEYQNRISNILTLFISRPWAAWWWIVSCTLLCLCQCVHSASWRHGVVCHLGYAFVSSVCYADDFVLLALSHSAVGTMLSICESLQLRDHGLRFNAAKTQLIVLCKLLSVWITNANSLVHLVKLTQKCERGHFS